MGIRRKPAFTPVYFPVFCQKASPPTSCTVSPHFPLGVFGNGKLGGKRRKKEKKTHQNSSKVPPSATDTLCSRKTEPALCQLCALVLVGHCSCWDFALSWGQDPPWMVTSHFVTHGVTRSTSTRVSEESVSCSTGAELVSWGRNGMEPTATAGA